MKLLIVLLVRFTSLAINPVTLSLNVTVTKNGAFVVVGDADVRKTIGGMVSITMALLAPNELAAPGVGNVKMASPLVAFLIVPPIKDRAVVEK